MFGNGFVVVSNGLSNGRSFSDRLLDGKLTVKLDDGFERVVVIQGGQIWDNTLKHNGKTVHRIVYGQFEIEVTEKGRNITRFHGKTGKGKHGKSRRYESLFDHDGVCHSWYKNGRLVKQKYIYDNRVIAYDYNAFKKFCTVKGYDGETLYEVEGVLDGRNNCLEGGHSVFKKDMPWWFGEGVPFCVKKKGKIFYKGQYENRQKVGEWVVDGKHYYFEKGVPIPEKLYLTPPEKLNPREVLSIENAQLRMAMCAKIGTEKIARCGKVIHKDGAMRLISVKGFQTNILRVQCPSTKAFYFLNVPKDSKQCEQARQWTFGVGMEFSKPIKFKIET